MPAGRYAVLGDDGARVGTEEFRCAPGPMGWRYFSDIQTTDPAPHVETIDVVVDGDWRPVRLRIDTGRARHPAGAARRRAHGRPDGVAIELPWEPDRHLDYFTPATNLITTRRLTDTTEIDVVYLAPVTLEPTLERQRYELIGDEEVETPVGRFAATRWRSRRSPTAGRPICGWPDDVVVRYDRLFELEWYEPGASGPRVVDVASTLRQLDLVGLHLDLEVDLLADQEPAGLDGHVPVDAPVLALDRGLRGRGRSIGLPCHVVARPQELARRA